MTQEMSNEFKELINEKISSVNAKLDAQTKSINEKMDLQHENIQVQLSAILEKANLKEKRIDEINKTIQGMIGVDAQHYINCINTKKIAEIEKTITDSQLALDKRLLAVDFLRVYPKWIIAGFVGLFFIGYFQLRGVETTLQSIKPGIEAFEKAHKSEDDKSDIKTSKEVESILHNKK